MPIKPSELLPSVHAYLSTRYPKAAKALQKEALLAAPARDAVVPLEAAAAAWSRRQARRGLDGAADLPRAVHSFLADCKLERAAKALRKEGRRRGAAPGVIEVSSRLPGARRWRALSFGPRGRRAWCGRACRCSHSINVFCKC